MIIDFGQGEGLEFDGDFRLYGTKDQLLNTADQIRDQAQKLEIGWVDVSPDGIAHPMEIKHWKDTKISE